MITEEQIEQFYEDVKKLRLVRPIAAITEATNWSKGNVSQYLSGKLKPSENFLNAFYNAFPKSAKKVSHETSVEEPELAYTRNKEDMIFDELSKIRQSNDKLIDQQGILVETNKKLADKLLSINSDDQQETYRSVVLKSLIDLIVKIGIDAGSWKDFRSGLAEVGKTLPDKTKAAGKLNRNGA